MLVNRIPKPVLDRRQIHLKSRLEHSSERGKKKYAKNFKELMCNKNDRSGCSQFGLL